MADTVSGVKRRGAVRQDEEDIVAAEEEQQQQPSAKRARANDSGAIIAHPSGRTGPDSYTALTIPTHVAATSSLPSALLTSPLLSTYELLGHASHILALKFHIKGQILASASRDKSVMLWRVPSKDDVGKPELGCITSLTGHTNAVTDLCWNTFSDEDRLYTVSADKTGGVWDTSTGQRIRKLVGHTSIINGVCVASRGEERMVSVGDDAFIKVWDCRSRAPAASFSDGYPLLAVEMSQDAQCIYTAGVEGIVKQWDMRKHTALLSLKGHNETITGLSLSPDGNSLLSFGMDNSLRSWDVRAFSAAADRCQKVFYGAKNNFEQPIIRCSWSPSGDQVACGSADRLVYVWDYESTEVAHMFPGHNGVVTAVDFHPHYPIIASGSFDKRIMVGSLESQAPEREEEENTNES